MENSAIMQGFTDPYRHVHPVPVSHPGETNRGHIDLSCFNQRVIMNVAPLSSWPAI